MICSSFTSTKFGHSGLFPARLQFSYFGEGNTVVFWLALLLITFHSSSCCPGCSAASLFFTSPPPSYTDIEFNCSSPIIFMPVILNPITLCSAYVKISLLFCCSAFQILIHSTHLFPISNSSRSLRDPSKPLSSSSPPTMPNRLTELNKSCWVFQKIFPYWNDIMVTLVCLISNYFPSISGKCLQQIAT